jgi:hypothetical protein
MMRGQACGGCKKTDLALLVDIEEGHNIAYCKPCTDAYLADYT